MENKNSFYSLSIYSCYCRRCCLTCLSGGWLFGRSTRSISWCVPTLLKSKQDIKILRIGMAYTNTDTVRYTMLRYYCSFAPLCSALLSAVNGSLFYIYFKALRCRCRRLNHNSFFGCYYSRFLSLNTSIFILFVGVVVVAPIVATTKCNHFLCSRMALTSTTYTSSSATNVRCSELGCQQQYDRVAEANGHE